MTSLLTRPLVHTTVTLDCRSSAAYVMRAWRGSPGWLVELAEPDCNPGPPIVSVFTDLIVTAQEMLPCSANPLWVEYWPQRAMAALLLGRNPVHARHHWTRCHDGSWLRAPLTWQSFAELVADLRVEGYLTASPRSPGGANQCQDSAGSA